MVKTDLRGESFGCVCVCVSGSQLSQPPLVSNRVVTLGF